MTTLEDLRTTIVADVTNYDEASTVTVGYKTEGDDGESYYLPSAFGRMVSATFTLPPNDEVATGFKVAADRVVALVEAGLFADVRDPEEFPGIDRSNIELSIHYSL